MFKTLGLAISSRRSHGFVRPFFPGIIVSSSFTTTAIDQRQQTQYPPRPKHPPEEEITEVYLKGSGPGGQKINKTSSAVQLKHLPTGIVVKCQETRSRSQNRKLARDHLAEKIDDFINGENSRSAVVARILARKKSSSLKKSRRKYRKLGEGEAEDGAVEDGAADDDAGQGLVEELQELPKLPTATRIRFTLPREEPRSLEKPPGSSSGTRTVFKRDTDVQGAA